MVKILLLSLYVISGLLMVNMLLDDSKADNGGVYVRYKPATEYMPDTYIVMLDFGYQGDEELCRCNTRAEADIKAESTRDYLEAHNITLRKNLGVLPVADPYRAEGD